MGSTATPSGAAKSTTITPGQSVQSQQSGRCCWTKSLFFFGGVLEFHLVFFRHICVVLYGLNTSYSSTCFKLVQHVNGAVVVLWEVLFACALNRCCYWLMIHSMTNSVVTANVLIPHLERNNPKILDILFHPNLDLFMVHHNFYSFRKFLTISVDTILLLVLDPDPGWELVRLLLLLVLYPIARKLLMHILHCRHCFFERGKELTNSLRVRIWETEGDQDLRHDIRDRWNKCSWVPKCV